MYNPTVYIIDDNEEVLKSLRWMLESVGYDVKTYNDAKKFISSYTPDQPGCILLDLRMPGMSGIELQEILIKQLITIPIIFITGHGDVSSAVRAMKRKAFDFLIKPVNNQILIERINKAIKKNAIDRKRIQKNTEIATRAEQLTPREREVMALIVAGKFTKAIADELNISPNTVEIHRSKVMKKMQAKSIAELVNLVLMSGLAED